MSNVTLTLADFTFQGMEIPPRIDGLGGDQMMAVHRLAGGTRVVDTMGKMYDPLTWSGLFTGPDALTRAKYLDYLRQQGKMVSLRWSTFSYGVIIQKFNYPFLQESRIPYSITCIVVTDDSEQIPKLAQGRDQALKSGAADAEAASGALKGQPVVQAKVSTLMALFKTVKDWARAAQATIKTVKDKIADVQGEITRALASVDNTLQDLTTLGGIVPGNPVSRNAASFMDNAFRVNDAVQLQNLKYALMNIDKNLDAQSTPIGASTISVRKASLFSLASQYYGDVSKWDIIASANKLSSPYVDTPMTLIIPDGGSKGA